MKIYPSLISANLLNLAQEIEKFDPWCDGYHIDIMDGHFVPSITWGAIFSNAIANKTQKPLNIHLMVSEPEKQVRQFIIRPQDTITVHTETMRSVESCQALFAHIKKQKASFGIALNPTTPVSELAHYLPLIDSVLIMSVTPGASGQIFKQEVLPKIDTLISMRLQAKASFVVHVDGGVNHQNIAELKQRFVDGVAVASAIFNQPKPEEALKMLYTICHNKQ